MKQNNNCNTRRRGLVLLLSAETRILVSMETLTAETASSRPRVAQLITRASTANRHTLGRRGSRGAKTFTNHPQSPLLWVPCMRVVYVPASAPLPMPFIHLAFVYLSYIGLCCLRPGPWDDLPWTSKALNPISSTVSGGGTSGHQHSPSSTVHIGGVGWKPIRLYSLEFFLLSFLFTTPGYFNGFAHPDTSHYPKNNVAALKTFWWVSNWQTVFKPCFTRDQHNIFPLVLLGVPFRRYSPNQCSFGVADQAKQHQKADKDIKQQ